jgi:hypothetical protein
MVKNSSMEDGLYDAKLLKIGRSGFGISDAWKTAVNDKLELRE